MHECAIAGCRPSTDAAAVIQVSHQPRGYIPRNVSEIMDLLGSMMLSSPTFKDDYFTDRSIETEFFRLNEALGLIRPKIGEVRFAKLMELSTRMRALFEADPDDKTQDAVRGRELILEMEDLLKRKA